MPAWEVGLKVPIRLISDYLIDNEMSRANYYPKRGLKPAQIVKKRAALGGLTGRMPSIMNIAVPAPQIVENKIICFNPVGYPPKVAKKSLAPRLETLDGKTVYLIDSRFDDSIELLKEVASWFASHMPAVTIKLVSMAGYYGRDDQELWSEIKANGHAAIIGVGHCSTCAPAVAVHCMNMEERGIATAPLVTTAFNDLVKAVTYKAGMPKLRFTFAPHPVGGKPPPVLREYVLGADPVTHSPFFESMFSSVWSSPQPCRARTGR